MGVGFGDAGICYFGIAVDFVSYFPAVGCLVSGFVHVYWDENVRQYAKCILPTNRTSDLAMASEHTAARAPDCA